MKRRSPWIGLAFLGAACLWAAPGSAAASEESARAQYLIGLKHYKAKEYPAALKYFKAALKQDTDFSMADKALGATYNKEGDTRQSIHYYEIYLAANPGDGATQALVRKLKGQSGEGEGTEPEATQDSAGTAPGGGKFTPGFDGRFNISPFFANDSDIDQLYGSAASGGSASNGPGTTIGYGISLGGDYGLANGFVVGFDIYDGYNRSGTGTYRYGAYTGSAGFNVDQWSFIFSPGWRFKLTPKIVLEPRLGLGFSTLYLAFSTGNYAAGEAWGTGFDIWPEVRAEYELGEIAKLGSSYAVGASLGYIIMPGAQVHYLSGTTVQYEDGGTATNWGLSTSGLTIGFYGVYHFKPLF
jgi:hypothetical protein